MCVIIYKPSGVKRPTKKILKNCWRRNQDGAGFAYLCNDNTWNVYKGFMSFNKFWKAFREHDIQTQHTCIVHFRIKSAGKVTPGSTHPFPITTDVEEMQTQEYNAPSVIFHNGTCGKGEDDLSDTMLFIRDFIAPMRPHIEDPAMKKIHDHLIFETHDRWLITKGNLITRYGNWIEDDGIWYSNMLWKPYKTTIIPYHQQHNHNNYGVIKPEVLIELEGVIKNDGTIVWDVEEIPDAEVEDNTDADDIDEDRFVMCPYCYEDKYLSDSPFVGMGNTMCDRCGCCFDAGDDVMWMYDEDLRASYLDKLSNSRAM